MEEFLRIHRLGRAFIKECTEGSTEYPYMIVDIDGYFSYFIKMVEDTVFPAVLTTEELIDLGYMEERRDESYNEIDTGDEESEVSHQGPGEDGLRY